MKTDEFNMLFNEWEARVKHILDDHDSYLYYRYEDAINIFFLRHAAQECDMENLRCSSIILAACLYKEWEQCILGIDIIKDMYYIKTTKDMQGHLGISGFVGYRDNASAPTAMGLLKSNICRDTLCNKAKEYATDEDRLDSFIQPIKFIENAKKQYPSLAKEAIDYKRTPAQIAFGMAFKHYTCVDYLNKYILEHRAYQYGIDVIDAGYDVDPNENPEPKRNELFESREYIDEKFKDAINYTFLIYACHVEQKKKRKEK